MNAVRSFFRSRQVHVWVIALIVLGVQSAPVRAKSPVIVGTYPSGPVDGITDVPGVRVGNLTKNEGSGPRIPGKGPVHTGATAILPNDDPWKKRVAAAVFDLNGNGEMTGAHWVEQSGFLETPIVLTDTLGVGRADDGVISWMIEKHPEIGVDDDVPLPLVAECDDQYLNDIQGRHVSARDVMTLLDAAGPGDFARGSVGAGTGMLAFRVKAGIGSASRVLPKNLGGYTVGVLVNANIGSQPFETLIVNGVHVGAKLTTEVNQRRSRRTTGRAADGSIIIVIATDAPLDPLRLRDVAKRATFGLALTGSTSRVSSGDLFVAFSTTRVTLRDGVTVGPPPVTDGDRIDALYQAVSDATQSAIYDAIFSATPVVGPDGRAVDALPFAKVAPYLQP
jgi:D-aminopeptidase